MSTSYLRSFVESVAGVPSELERWFRGIRELDDKAHTLQLQLEADCNAQLRALLEESAPATKKARVTATTGTPEASPAPVPDTSELAQRIEATTAELLRLSAEKTETAQQVYDHIDQHIRRLDKELKAFDAEIAVERSKLGLPPVEGVPAEADMKRGKKDAVAVAAPPPLTSEELYRAALAAADASEPTYCTCKRISFGEMIACDNPECAVEWFHFECVGLTPETRPKGKWYCKDCRKLLGKK